MKNNYKILIGNYDKSKKFNNYFYNYSLNDNYNFLIAKFIFVFVLFAGIFYRLNIMLNIIALENQEIFEEEESNTKGHVIKQRKSDYWNITLVKNEMHYYSLYNQFKIPQFSFVLLDNDNNDTNFIETLDNINRLISQNFSFIEIILHRQKIKKNEYKNLYRQFKELLKDNTIKLYVKSENISGLYSSCINLSKGVYTIFINDSYILNKINLQNLYQYKLTKVDNIFNYNVSKNMNIYLLKTKILKDLIDNGKNFFSFNDILTNVSTKPLTNFNYIHISFCPDNRFSKLAYVSMISILSSKNFNSFICFYLIIPQKFGKNNINFLESLHEQYEDFNITFITMDNRYQRAYTDRRITTQAYYRFSLGEFLPNLNKIIYFDTDIIVYKDLSNFYNLNFNGKMILGQATYGNKEYQKHGSHQINTGVLLLNLKAMREFNFETKVIKIIKKGRKLGYHDQTLLNSYFKHYLGIFPPEYHTRPWSNFKEMKKFIARVGPPFNKDYFYFANKYPVVRHFLGGYKPRNPWVNFIEDWWFFARKSKYYNQSSRSFESAFSY